MMLPWLCCQTRYERVCFRSDYHRPTNKEPCTYEGNGAPCTLPKINRPEMIFALLGTPSLPQGYHLCRPPIQESSFPPSNPAQAPHCHWTLSHGSRHAVHRSCDAIIVARMLQSLHLLPISDPNKPSSHSIARCPLHKVLSSRHRICESLAMLC